MTDRLAIQLSNDWAILYDHNQWIIAKARLSGTGGDWRPVSYIGSNKTTLARILLKKGVQIDSATQAVIETWPERFLDWIKRQNAERRAA
jgi:hypothetical protein